MTNSTLMREQTVADVMRPISAPIALNRTSAEARARMSEENRSFLIVVGPDDGRLVGVVLRRGVEQGCESNGHDPNTCPLGQHLSCEVDTCSREDLLREIRTTALSDAASEIARDRRERLRRRLPVIVVNGEGAPLGYLPR